MSDRPSIAFDRAAEYYDETRGLSPDAVRRSIGVLEEELRGRGRVLEIGVGTGQVAIPLAERGVRVIGIDLSAPMLRQLVRKPGGKAVPLALGDATRLPVRDGAFGGAVVRWVLHLIPAWPSALGELVRAMRPGSPLAIQIGSFSGARSEIQDRFAELSGIAHEPAGLDWGAVGELDEAAAAAGAPLARIRAYQDRPAHSLEGFIDALEGNRFSWTWGAPEDTVRAAAAQVRAWARERFGPLDRIAGDEAESAWRVYVRS